MRTRDVLFFTVMILGGLAVVSTIPSFLQQEQHRFAAGDELELPFEATGPVATIDGEEIPAERFNEEVRRMVKVTQGRVPPQMLSFYKKQILERLVDEHLLDKVVAEKKVVATEKDLDEELQKLASRFPNPEQYKLFLERMEVDEKELREDLRAQTTYKKLFEQHYGVSVKPAQVKRYYRKNIERFTEEEQVRARHILIKVSKDASDEVAEDAVQRIAEVERLVKLPDADFAEIAKAHSEGPSAPKGGDLGFFPRKRMVKPFADAAFALEAGQVSGPVRTQFGWHIILVEEKKPAHKKAFGEVKGQIEEQLYSTAMREAMAKLLKELEAKHEVVLKEENIKMNVAVPADVK